MDKVIIDLENFRTKGSKVFTGRERGQTIRNESKIENLIEDGKTIEIIIPEDIMSVNPSFLEELLFPIVTKLGKLEFNLRVKFTSKSTRYDINEDLEEAVERILRSGNALSKK